MKGILKSAHLFTKNAIDQFVDLPEDDSGYAMGSPEWRAYGQAQCALLDLKEAKGRLQDAMRVLEDEEWIVLKAEDMAETSREVS